MPNDPTTQALIRVEDAGNNAIVDESDAVFTIEQADPRLTAPNGGQHLSAGRTFDIEWDDGYFVATVVVIEYSVDSGATWNTISTGTTNDGSYTWTIPNNPSTQALVRVSEFNNSAVFDISDADFNMYKHIHLTAPAAGASVNGCESINISWRAGSTSESYKIEYSSDGGSTWTTINNSWASTSTHPTYSWNLPNITSSQLRFRVSDANNGSKVDESGDITIGQSQYLTLSEPNGGELLIAGASFQIDYLTSGPVNNVSLQYNTNNGTGSWTNITTSTNGGSYNWTVPNIDADSVVVRVRDASNTCITATSPAFEIRSEITVTAANGGESWKAVVPVLTNNSTDVRISDGSTATVQDGYRFMDSGGTGNYTISGYGSDQITLYPAVDGAKVQVDFTQFHLFYHYYSYYNTDLHTLTIYNGPSTSSSTIGSYTQTTSPGTVTSTHSTGALTFRITSNGTGSDPGWLGDITLVGGNPVPTEQITWNTTGSSGSYDLSYSTDNGGNWKEITNGYTTNTGIYEWMVPNDPSTQALIRVEDAGNNSIVDQSDAVFSLSKPILRCCRQMVEKSGLANPPTTLPGAMACL